MSKPAFTASRYEMDLILKIARRAHFEFFANRDVVSLVMDFELCHCNGTPLRLAELGNASDDDFAHDVAMIAAKLDRKTGKLTGIGVPRFALEQVTA